MLLPRRRAGSGHSPQEQRFAGLIERSPSGDPDLLKDLVCQPSETEHVDIQDPFLRGSRDDLFLCLHGILVRDKDNVILTREITLLNGAVRTLQKHAVQGAALAGTRGAETKSVAHSNPSSASYILHPASL